MFKIFEYSFYNKVDFVMNFMYTNSKIIIGGDTMCTKSEVNIITSAVAEEAKRLLGDKLDAVILYGSYARGDYDDESDIDVMVRVICKKEERLKYRKLFVHFASSLSLEYDIVVSLNIVDTETFNRYRNHLPFYKNVESEGIKIA